MTAEKTDSGPLLIEDRPSARPEAAPAAPQRSSRGPSPPPPDASVRRSGSGAGPEAAALQKAAAALVSAAQTGQSPAEAAAPVSRTSSGRRLSVPKAATATVGGSPVPCKTKATGRPVGGYQDPTARESPAAKGSPGAGTVPAPGRSSPTPAGGSAQTPVVVYHAPDSQERPPVMVYRSTGEPEQTGAETFSCTHPHPASPLPAPAPAPPISVPASAIGPTSALALAPAPAAP